MTDLCRRGIRKTSSDTCVDLYILLLKYLANHMHAITNGLFKHLFSKTNSTDPRQRVPLSPNLHRLNLCSTHLRIIYRCERRVVTSHSRQIRRKYELGLTDQSVELKPTVFQNHPTSITVCHNMRVYRKHVLFLKRPDLVQANMLFV